MKASSRPRRLAATNKTIVEMPSEDEYEFEEGGADMDEGMHVVDRIPAAPRLTLSTLIAPSKSSSTTDSPSKTRRRRSKVGNACVFCRRSHMTCDDVKPCSRCIKRNISHLCTTEMASSISARIPTVGGADSIIKTEEEMQEEVEEDEGEEDDVAAGNMSRSGSSSACSADEDDSVATLMINATTTITTASPSAVVNNSASTFDYNSATPNFNQQDPLSSSSSSLSSSSYSSSFSPPSSMPLYHPVVVQQGQHQQYTQYQHEHHGQQATSAAAGGTSHGLNHQLHQQPNVQSIDPAALSAPMNSNNGSTSHLQVAPSQHYHHYQQQHYNHPQHHTNNPLSVSDSQQQRYQYNQHLNPYPLMHENIGARHSSHHQQPHKQMQYGQFSTATALSTSASSAPASSSNTNNSNVTNHFSTALSSTSNSATAPSHGVGGASVAPSSQFFASAQMVNEFSVLNEFFMSNFANEVIGNNNSGNDNNIIKSNTSDGNVVGTLESANVSSSSTLANNPDSSSNSTSTTTSKRTTLALVSSSSSSYSSLMTPVLTNAELFILTAADPEDGKLEERLGDIINAKFQAGLLQPFDYKESHQRLVSYIQTKLSSASSRRISTAMETLGTRLQWILENQFMVDQILVEESFERLLLKYDRTFASMGIPACLWRRTGEIWKCNNEFADLIGIPSSALNFSTSSTSLLSSSNISSYSTDSGGVDEGTSTTSTSTSTQTLSTSQQSSYIYEIMTEESATNYFEKYCSIAADPGQKAVLTSCILKKPAVREMDETSDSSVQQQQNEQFTVVPCSFSFTVRRDRFNVPLAIIGHFLPTS